jgi:hypothetical protein
MQFKIQNFEPPHVPVVYTPRCLYVLARSQLTSSPSYIDACTYEEAICRPSEAFLRNAAMTEIAIDDNDLNNLPPASRQRSEQ